MEKRKRTPEIEAWLARADVQITKLRELEEKGWAELRRMRRDKSLSTS